MLWDMSLHLLLFLFFFFFLKYETLIQYMEIKSLLLAQII